MKKLFLVLLTLLLTGCYADPAPAQIPGANHGPAEAVYPSPYYLRSELWFIPVEGGSIAALEIPEEDPVVLPASGTVIRYCADTGRPLSIMDSAEFTYLSLTGEGTLYGYCPDSRELVYFTPETAESHRLVLPSDTAGHPVTDGQTVYYASGNALWSWDMETGIRRVLRQLAETGGSPGSLSLAENCLTLEISDSAHTQWVLFLSRESGRILAEKEGPGELITRDSCFFARITTGSMEQYLFSGPQGETLELRPGSDPEGFAFLPESCRGVAVISGEDGFCLELYDLSTGRRTACLPGIPGHIPGIFREDRAGNIWFTLEGPWHNGLCRWDPSQSLVEDPLCYTTPYYPDSQPDAAGLARCRQLADRVAQPLGIRIFTGPDATASREPGMETEWQPGLLLPRLKDLEVFLANYPPEILSALSRRFGGLNLCLVRSLIPSAPAQTRESLLYFREDGAYIALSLGKGMEQALCRELCHLMDTVIMSDTALYSRWNEINPGSFRYDYCYVTNATRDAAIYLQDDEFRSFVDTFSMSFPREDRASIMVQAMQPGNRELFDYPILQQKLEAICRGIREAFGLSQYPRSFLWEQYLHRSLTPDS